MSARLSPRLFSCVGVDFDLALLPSFLRHYIELGVTADRIHVIVNADSDRSPRLEQALQTLASFGAEPAEVWISDYTSDGMWEKRRDAQRRLSAPDEWVISADVDEFHQYPEPLHAMVDYCEKRHLNCVQGVFIDRLAPDGKLIEADSEASVKESFPVKADVICSIGTEQQRHDRYGTVKLMLYKAQLFPSRGGHSPIGGGPNIRYLFGRPLAKSPACAVPGFRFAFPFQVHHFKWRSSMIESLRKRLATPGVSPAGSAYGRVLLDHVDKHGGIDLATVALPKVDPRRALPWRLRMKLLRRQAHSALRAEAKLDSHPKAEVPQ